MSDNSGSSKNSRRHRSPAYPSISLPEAVEKARALYQREKMNPFTPEVALDHWRYDAGSGNGMRAIAALKQYGLLDEKKTGNDRELRFTDLGIDILIPETVDSSEHLHSLREAALAPVVFRDIWDRRSEHGLPSDRNLERYLIKEKKFNPAAVPSLIRIFRESLKYAKIQEDDAVDKDDAAPPNKDGPPKDFTGSHGNHPNWPAFEPQGNGPMRELTITLPSTREVKIRIPEKLDSQDFDFMTDLIKKWRPRFVHEDLKDDSHY